MYEKICLKSATVLINRIANGTTSRTRVLPGWVADPAPWPEWALAEERQQKNPPVDALPKLRALP